ncbi:putative 3-hydroxyacyl-CoA dehydrogenase [Desulfamplus magnetovallimortis]|uniref:Putative 3-hydroxyacyl-CoA dehydrogenase n=1 Tax=Desulfamplus magnetovallimortis TaxID=1246637 RepID=A0A1W1H7H0_9BACT|nr:3-hydroxyacyl-CoA dehydrogenase [Desulfamplus magnetovallimortis]SLM28403.1 putative 3-hydroxyacyl-CoA dehydrogenase [Desulfamplus magnetovallimortis]
MKVEDIKKILIVGGGTMGQQTALICALHGYDVAMHDISMEILEKGFERLKKNCIRITASGEFTPEEGEAAIKRIILTDKPEIAAQDADLIIESVPEDPALKAKIFASFHELCKPETVFTTNTSTLVPSMFAHAVGRPEKFCAFHFHDIAITKIVDIMPHPGTDPETIALVREFAIKIGQIPIELKTENHGYVFNNMLMAFIGSALTLASRKVASVEDIDRSWMGVLHTPLGPFGMIDSIGIDTVWKVTDFWAQKRQDKHALGNAAFLREYVDKGDLGVKTGRGFYEYPAPAFAKKDFLTSGK